MSRRIKVFLLAAAFALLLAVIILIYRAQWLAPAQLVLTDTSNQVPVVIGARGPVTLKFAKPMLHESAEGSLSFDPPVTGRFTWEGSTDQTVSFWPARSLQPGAHFTMHLAAGVRSKSGRTLRQAQTWQIEVRQPGLLYLAPSQAPELWLVSGEGQHAARLTHTGGGIYDYGVSFDGSHIAYAVKNERQGYDLWEMDRQGKSARLVLPCGADWCTTPSYSPDGNMIVYSRRKVSGLPGRQPEIPRIWTVDRAAQTTTDLFADPNIHGTRTYWSPDGRYLAFYDEGSAGVRIYNTATHSSSLSPAAEGTGTEWSPDSKSLLYLEAALSGEQPYNRVIQMDAATQARRPIFPEAVGMADYTVPAISSDGKWMAIGERITGGSLTRQIWLVRLGEGETAGDRQAITDDVLYNHAGYQWQPGGSRLVFQRLAYGASDSLPQVMVWDQLNNQTLLVAEDAYQPLWIP